MLDVHVYVISLTITAIKGCYTRPQIHYLNLVLTLLASLPRFPSAEGDPCFQAFWSRVSLDDR